MNQEPAAIVGGATAILSAVAVLLRSFGVGITEDQENAIRGVVAIVAPIVSALVIRSFVVSPATARAKVKEAHLAGKAGTPTPPSVKA